MTTQIKTVEQVLEEGGERYPEIVALYNWGLNYEPGEGVFTLFLDLIGYAMDEIGEPLYNLANVSHTLGYLELDYLGDALKEYARIGEDAYYFVVSIIEAEMGIERVER